MSAPLIWIILPAAIGFILFVLQYKTKLVIALGTIAALGLAILAWIVPIGGTVTLGSFSFELNSTLLFFGRRFVLDANDRYILILIYLGVAFWFTGSPSAHVHRFFIPLGLAIAALLTSALAVEPFLYASLIIEIMVIISLPLLSPPGSHPGRGAIRYLTFQTLGFPFVLFTGWLLTGAESSPANSEPVILSGLLLSLGFGLLLGIFPFHTWIPMLGKESHPYSIAFIYYVLPLALSLFMLGFLDSYVWLRESANLYQLLGIVGAMMVFFGGLWAAFQRHLGGMMGYAVMVEIGISLLAIQVGLGPDGSGDKLGLFFALLLPRALSLGVWALSMVVLARGLAGGESTVGNLTSIELTFTNVRGLARRYPFAVSSLLLAHLSIATMPVLAGFPVRLTILEELGQSSMVAALLVLSGFVGLLVGGIRSMAVLVLGNSEEAWQSKETFGERILLILGGIAIIFIGIAPQLFTPAMARMVEAFIHLTP